MDVMLGKLLDGRYQVVKILGSGGFSQTYIAEDTRRPSYPPCVIKHLKLFRSELSFLPEIRARFQMEAKALEKLGTHDQIPQLLACFEENQELFLVVEFIEGHPLSDELATKQLSEAEVVTLLWDVLSVLKFVHSQQIIHRDIKPSNLIRRQRDGKIALIDFGAVKAIQTQITNSPPTIRIGTPGYTPPEQDAGNPAFNSDLYALGITAIQALSGLCPNQLVNLDGQVSWQDQVEVSQGLAAMLTKMCRFSAERYQSAQECLDELKKLAESSSIAPATVQVARPKSAKMLSRLITSDRTFFSPVTGVGLIFVLAVTSTVLESSRSQTAQANLSEVKRLQAEKKYQDCLDQAEGLVYSFGINPNLRNQAQKLLSQCQVAIAQQTIQKAKQLAASGKLVNAIATASQVSPDSQLAAAELLIASWTQRLLDLGWTQYHAGKLDKAIAYAYTIPATAPNYQTAQGIVTQWQKDWQTAASQFNQAQQALNQNRWQEAIDIAQRVPAPNNRFWQARLATIVQRAETAKQTEAAKRTQRTVHILELLNRDRDQVGKTALEKAYPNKVFKSTAKVSELQTRRNGDKVTFRFVVTSQGWFWTTEAISFDWEVMMLKKQHIQASVGNRDKLDAYHIEELNNYFLMLAEQYL